MGYRGYTNIKAVRVHEVIMSGSSAVVGTIKYKDLPAGRSLDTKRLPSARPLFKNISQYPTINEIVLILAGPRDSYNVDGSPTTYYLPPINIYGSPNHNALPNELTLDEIKAESETGLAGSNKNFFREANVIKPLQPYHGDVIIEGRYGNSVRFGYTVRASESIDNPWSNEGPIGRPITIIKNGQHMYTTGSLHIEDINEDRSSIYLCSGQQISNFMKAGIPSQEYPLSYKHMLKDE